MKTSRPWWWNVFWKFPKILSVCLIELLAGYVAAFLWGGLTRGRHVVLYIDNEASRLASIKAYSSTQVGKILVQMFVAKEDASQWKVWFGRVCSNSNIADTRSRMEAKDLVTRGAVQDQCAWDVILLSLEEIEHNLGLGWRRVLRLSQTKRVPILGWTPWLEKVLAAVLHPDMLFQLSGCRLFWVVYIVARNPSFANAILYMNTDLVGSIYAFNAEREYTCDHFCLVAGSAFQGFLCWWFC